MPFDTTKTKDGTAMSVDIRKYTRVIVQKNGQYLFCVSEFTKEPEWRTSPWDAWWTRKADIGRSVADRIGGVPMLFNPAIGKVKTL